MIFRKSLSDVPRFSRRGDLTKLFGWGSVGIELGVAEGRFSRRILKDRRVRHLFSVDMWAGDRGHDVEQYKSAVRRLAKHCRRNTILRLTFDQSLDLFPDASFDFVYVDGYAHTGEENGRTIRSWWPKLKPGGIMAGDDYDPEWPLVVQAVDRFMADNALVMAVLRPRDVENKWSRFPSWVTVKPRQGRQGAKTIALVGNGPVRACDAKLIDRHEIVVRFNGAHHCGEAGRRTDALVILQQAYMLAEPINQRALGRETVLWLHRPPYVSGELPTGRMINALPFKTIDAPGLEDELNAVGGTKKGSSGVFALHHLLREHPQARISLFGFGHTGNEKHDWDAERAWCDRQIASGRVVRHETA